MKPTGFKSKMMRGLAFPQKGKPPFKLVYIAGVMHEKGDELLGLTKNLMANHGQKIYVNAMKGAPALPFLNSWKKVRKASGMIRRSDKDKARIMEKEEKKKQKMLADAEKERLAHEEEEDEEATVMKQVSADVWMSDPKKRKGQGVAKANAKARTAPTAGKAHTTLAGGRRTLEAVLTPTRHIGVAGSKCRPQDCM